MLEAEECFGDEGRRGGGHDERGDGVDLRDDELVDLGGGRQGVRPSRERRAESDTTPLASR